ncbi:uncharacterized protein LOC116512713 isoform X2 [Thamnophis elegans]|uniref:uncharacterized protein LOC116512713 isoform X2 n=1 Tax=Thamnophis elegans TaxID=35005 RepID=UPI0013780181|nr:uncharacterized protein LOC116512713 isoform X2 [Thamnophis elegans]
MGCSSSAQTKVKEFGRQTPKSPEANGLPQCDFLEAGGPQAVESTELASNPQVAAEAAGSSPSESLHDKKPEPSETSEGGTPEPSTEEIRCFVTEIVTELLMDEEEQLTDVTVPGEAGEKVETETHHEIIPGASETKEETREATLVTEIEQANEE